jgi:bifunctional DNA primase/polymerase-like protein
LTAITTRLTPKQQEAILNWPENRDIPIFPADTRNKEIKIYNWQNFDFTQTDFKAKLANGEYDNGIAIRMGKTLSGKYYSVAFDFDGWDAVVEWFGNWDNVVVLSKKTVVEWHQDQGKIHVIFLSRTPFQNRKIHIKNAFLEIRCERNALFASPSIHKEGKPYEPLGTNQISLIADDKTRALKAKITTVCHNYMSDEDKQKYDEWLDLPTTILGENQGRHDATKFKVNRYYWKYAGEWLNLSDEQRFERAWQWHLAHCNPPRSRQEFNSLCKWAIDTFRVERDKKHEKVRAERQQWNECNQKRSSADKKEVVEPKPKKNISYKCTNNEELYEEIRLGGKSVFLTLVDGEPKIVEEIDQSDERGIIIGPHSTVGMLPTFSYEFKDTDEIKRFIDLAQNIYIDDLYFLVKSIWSELIATKEPELLVLLSADTIHSYYQEQFVTVHYLRLTGPPGWGKGAILLTFKLLGYRVVLAGDMSGPNLLDILGPIEKCQVTLAEDEFDKIEEDEVKERIYKMGYEDIGFVTRTVDPSSSDRDVRYYNPFGIKIFGGEQPSEGKKLGGFDDRTFSAEVTKGKPRKLVKEIKKQMEKPQEKQLPKYRIIIERIRFIRNLMLIHRLIHHNDTIEEINTNIDSRPLELCGPALRLFNSPQLANGDKKALNEIKDAFSHFLRKKGQLDKKTIEVVLSNVLKRLFKEIDTEEHQKESRKTIETKLDDEITNYTLTYDLICDQVMQEVEGTRLTNRSFESAEFPKVSHDYLLQRCRTIFIAKDARISEGKDKKKALRFDYDTTIEAASSFEVVTEIEIYDHAKSEDIAEDDTITKMWNDIGCGSSCQKVLQIAKSVLVY